MQASGLSRCSRAGISSDYPLYFIVFHDCSGCSYGLQEMAVDSREMGAEPLQREMYVYKFICSAAVKKRIYILYTIWILRCTRDELLWRDVRRILEGSN